MAIIQYLLNLFMMLYQVMNLKAICISDIGF